MHPLRIVVALSSVTASAPPESARNRLPEPFRTTLETVSEPTVAVAVLAMSKPVVLPTVKPVSVLPLPRVTPLPAALVMVGSVPAGASVVPETTSAVPAPCRVWVLSSVMPPV